MKRIVWAIACAVMMAGGSHAQITVDLPLPPPPDREAVLAGINADPSSDPKMLHYLLDYDLCTRVASDGSQMIATTGADGEAFSPVFTTKERVRAVYGGDAMPLCTAGRAMLGYMRGKRVVFDPTGSHSVTWPSEEVRRILKAGAIPEPVAYDFETPDTLPADLVARLTRLFRGTPEINGAWLAVATRSGSDPPVWRLEIHADQDVDRVALDAKLRQFMNALETPALTMQVIVFPDLGLGGLGRKIYTR